MLKFKGFKELVGSYINLPHGMLYSVEEKENDIANAVFYAVSTDETKILEYVEGDLGEVPEEIYSDDYIVCELIETETFKDIIKKRIEQDNNFDIKKDVKIFFDALKFYLENDTFME